MSQLWERHPIADSPLSVVVLNENWAADTLRQMLTELQPILDKLNNQYEVLVPIDGTDEAELHPALAACPNTRLVIKDGVFYGQGVALSVGIASAQHPLVFILPAGYSPKYLPAYLKEIDLVDVVCGSRRAKPKAGREGSSFQ